MIRDNLWMKVCHARKYSSNRCDKILCRHCIEKALGRKLTLDDLGDYIECWFDKEFVRRFYGRRADAGKRLLSGKRTLC